jgi:hypothetical protein
MTKLTKYGTDPKRQDSSFYTNEVGTELVWSSEDNPFAVYREGEMRIHAVNKNGHDEVIRYTDKLEEFGIKTDKELSDWSGKGEEVFSWVNNSWFVVLHDTDTDWFSEPFHELDTAIAYAEKAKLAPEKYLAGVWA